jgi:hypothetical protein
MMDITVTMNFWFLISLCLLSMLIGMLLRRSSNSRDRYR